MGMDLERLKHCIPLLGYLQQNNWSARSAGISQEFVGFVSPASGYPSILLRQCP
jgi:hypothetical protein